VRRRDPRLRRAGEHAHDRPRVTAPRRPGAPRRGFWEAPPSETALRGLGAEPGELPDIAGLVAAAQAAGYEPGYAHLSTTAEWDHYEWSWTGGAHRVGADRGPGGRPVGGPGAGPEHRRQYLAGYRRELGFATVVLHDVG
jgi:hypothetical protein